MNVLEEARAWGQALLAKALRYASHVNNAVDRHLLHVRSPTFDATLKDGLGCALLTCVFASIPLAYWLSTFDVSYGMHAPLWYALVLLTNLPETRLPRKTRWQCVFSAFMAVMVRLGYCDKEYAVIMCSLCFFIRMHGMGLVSIVWQLRVEVNIYGRVMMIFFAPKMTKAEFVAMVRADGMIWNPVRFMWCCAVAFNWSSNTAHGIRRSDWTRIVSWKRACFALNFWRFMAFYGIPKFFYFACENLYSIYTVAYTATETVPQADSTFIHPDLLDFVDEMNY